MVSSHFIVSSWLLRVVLDDGGLGILEQQQQTNKQACNITNGVLKNAKNKLD